MEFNTGLKISTIPPTAFIAGEFSPMFGHRRATEDTGFWKNYLPKAEVQNANGFDEMNCTIRATQNCLEVEYKFATGLDMDWSDRHVSKTSGNTRDGNYVHIPAEAIKEFGMVKEEEYPNQAPNWEVYYQAIPSNVAIKAKELTNVYDVDREFIFPSTDPELLYQKLLENPLGVTVRYASSEDPNEILNPSGIQNHMVMVYGAKHGEYWEIFDHYEWQRGKGVTKRYAWNYPFGTALRFFLTKKNNSTFMFKQNYPYLLVEGSEQRLGFYLDGKLVIDEDWSKILVQSASRLKRYEPAIPVKLVDFNSVPHVNLKGEAI